jgi:hypothetical protein
VIGGRDCFPKHNPVTWVEAAIEDAMSMRVRGALSQCTANSPKADVVCHIIGKQRSVPSPRFDQSLLQYTDQSRYI